MSKEILILKREISSPELGTRMAVPVLGLIGTGISGYLTYIHYENLDSICIFGATCDIVLTSPYAQMWGIPLALFGLLLYVAITVLGVLFSVNTDGIRRGLIVTGIYALALSGTLFTLYLYYLEIFEIHAFCTWCIGSSIVMFALFGVSCVNLETAGFNALEFRRWLSQHIQR